MFYKNYSIVDLQSQKREKKNQIIKTLFHEDWFHLFQKDKKTTPNNLFKD